MTMLSETVLPRQICKGLDANGWQEDGEGENQRGLGLSPAVQPSYKLTIPAISFHVENSGLFLPKHWEQD